MKDIRANQVPTVQSPSEIYHEASKLRRHDNLFKTIYSVNNFPEIRRVIAKPCTSHPGFPAIALPTDFAGLDRSASQVLLERKSAREFSGASMPLADMAAILYFGSAVTRETVDEFGITWGFRCAPSGGALYPIDIYCVVNRVASLEGGLYGYDAGSHSLQLLKQHDYVESLVKATYVANAGMASFCVLMAANFARSKFKYGERAYRFALLEAGHICQNMLLAAEAVRRGAYPIGGYIDDILDDLIGVDGCDRAVIYGLMAGCVEAGR
jgi:SagB-type dehydrogenase family enzyme